MIWYAQADGNINDTGMWGDDPTTPANYVLWGTTNISADTLKANGHTVAVNVPVTCAKLDTETTGGVFEVVAVGNLTITADLLAVDNKILNYGDNGDDLLTIVGEVEGGSVDGIIAVNSSTGGETVTSPLKIIGEARGGSAYGCPGISIDGARATPTLVVGNVYGGSGDASPAVIGGDVTVEDGVVRGGSGSDSCALMCGVVTLTRCNLLYSDGYKEPIRYDQLIFNPRPSNYVEYTSSGGVKKLGWTIPAEGVLTGVVGDGVDVPAEGVYDSPDAEAVIVGTDYGYPVGDDGWSQHGLYRTVAPGDIRYGVGYGVYNSEAPLNGSCYVPAATDVRSTVATGTTTGNMTLPTEAQVQDGVHFGAAGTEYEGTFAGGGSGGGPLVGGGNLV